MENLILKSVRFNAFVIKVLSLFAVIIFSSCNGGDGIVKCEMPKSVALSASAFLEFWRKEISPNYKICKGRHSLGWPTFFRAVLGSYC